MQRAIALSLLVILGVAGLAAYTYSVYLPSIGTASPGSGTLSIYLADPPAANSTIKYLLVNVTSVTLQYSSNVTATTSTSSTSSASSSATSSTSSSSTSVESTSTQSSSATSFVSTTQANFVNRYVYNVSSSVGTNVNITKYQGSALLLGSPNVPTGNVTGVILNITGAKAFWANGTSSQLKVVANGKLMVHVQFTIQSGGNSDMNIDITPASVHVSQGDVLRPVLLVTVSKNGSSTTETSTTSASSTTSSSSSTSSA